MKSVTVTLAGQEFHLVFNGAAMFVFEDAFGGSSAYFQQCGSAGREGFGAVCRAAAILAEQGELVRRALGYDGGQIPDAEFFLTCTGPMDMITLRRAVSTAILAGYGREVESGEDIDIGLQELEQKKTHG